MFYFPFGFGAMFVWSDCILPSSYRRLLGELFSPWNQVDLIFEKSGQPFYWALEFQTGDGRDDSGVFERLGEYRRPERRVPKVC